ncbi:hypothetical protein K0U00_51490, partial [Paenibacillus sepulcri]|nr:hypothetical protein [Paenibacillus sepulcri]
APTAPWLALAADTGSSDSDGVTSTGEINVTGLETGAAWEYSTDAGQNWHSGTGTNVVLAEGDYASRAVQVRQTDAAGNVSTVGTLSGAVKVDV